MGLGETIGLVAVAVAVIVLLSVVAGSFQSWVAYKQRKLEVEAEANRARLAECGDHAEMLEERVRVLERIATDRGQDIAHQIERLREGKLEEKL